MQRPYKELFLYNWNNKTEVQTVYHADFLTPYRPKMSACIEFSLNIKTFFVLSFWKAVKDFRRKMFAFPAMSGKSKKTMIIFLFIIIYSFIHNLVFESSLNYSLRRTTMITSSSSSTSCCSWLWNIYYFSKCTGFVRLTQSPISMCAGTLVVV